MTQGQHTRETETTSIKFLDCAFSCPARAGRGRARSPQKLSRGCIFCCCPLAGFFFFLKRLCWPHISFHPHFFSSPLLGASAGHSEQAVFNPHGRRRGDAAKVSLDRRGPAVNSVNRAWAQAMQSVVPSALYGAGRCRAQAAEGRPASCARLRSPWLPKPACFSPPLADGP